MARPNRTTLPRLAPRHRPLHLVTDPQRERREMIREATEAVTPAALRGVRVYA